MNLTTKNLPESVEPATPPAADPCPRCGKTLVDPAGLGWCPGCGYCKSLAEDNTKNLLTDKKAPSLGGMVEAGGAIAGLPMWFWACPLFLAIGVAFAIFMDKRLPAGDNLERATWATIQIAVGVLMIFLAQVFALVSIAPDEPTLSFKDAVAAFRLWPMVGKRLPRLKGCLWMALLGLSLIVGSAAFIGGFQHWFTYLPKSATERDREAAKESSGRGAPVVIGD